MSYVIKMKLRNCFSYIKSHMMYKTCSMKSRGRAKVSLLRKNTEFGWSVTVSL